MAEKKIVASCHIGGKLLIGKDGTQVYEGGFDCTVDIMEQTVLSDLRRAVAERGNLSSDPVVIRYLHPRDKRRLITILDEKDLGLMVISAEDFPSIDVYVDVEVALSLHGTDVANNGGRLSFAVFQDSFLNKRIELFLGFFPLGKLTVFLLCSKSRRMEVSEAAGTAQSTSFAPSPVEGDCGTNVRQSQNFITLGLDFSGYSCLLRAANSFATEFGNDIEYGRDGKGVSVKCRMQGCPWSICASKVSTGTVLSITEINFEHACLGVSRIAGFKEACGFMDGDINDNHAESLTGKSKGSADYAKYDLGALLNYLRDRYGVKVGHGQPNNSAEDACNELLNYCNKLNDMNRGSIITVSRRENSSFHRLFISFSASRMCFSMGCRPLVFIERYPLNSIYRGLLLTATGADANDGAFPLAFAIVNGEADDSWHWFFVELKAALDPTYASSRGPKITFVADFEKDLKDSLTEVFGKNCYHCYCLRYLTEKLIKNLRCSLSHKARSLVVKYFRAAAYAPKVKGFENYMASIKRISLEAYDWIMTSGPNHWANAFFEGARYNLMTANFGHSFYSWVSEAKGMSITQVVDALIDIIAEEHDEGRNRRSSSDGWLTSIMEKRLRKEDAKEAFHGATHTNGQTCKVSGLNDEIEVVKLKRRECSCRVWQLTGLPCAHAIAALESVYGCQEYDIFDYCSTYMNASAYGITYFCLIRRVSDCDRPLKDYYSDEYFDLPRSTKSDTDLYMPRAESVKIVKRCLYSDPASGRNE